VFPAAQNLLLAAAALGYGSTLTTLAAQDRAGLAALVGLPDGVRPLAVVPVGRPAAAPGPPRRRPAGPVPHPDPRAAARGPRPPARPRPPPPPPRRPHPPPPPPPAQRVVVLRDEPVDPGLQQPAGQRVERLVGLAERHPGPRRLAVERLQPVPAGGPGPQRLAHSLVPGGLARPGLGDDLPRPGPASAQPVLRPPEPAVPTRAAPVGVAGKHDLDPHVAVLDPAVLAQGRVQRPPHLLGRALDVEAELVGLHGRDPSSRHLDSGPRQI